jgi:hypothetical protein
MRIMMATAIGKIVLNCAMVSRNILGVVVRFGTGRRKKMKCNFADEQAGGPEGGCVKKATSDKQLGFL